MPCAINIATTYNRSLLQTTSHSPENVKLPACVVPSRSSRLNYTEVSYRTGNSLYLSQVSTNSLLFLHVWRLGVVVSGVGLINEVNRHWARLVLGWVTDCGRVIHFGM